MILTYISITALEGIHCVFVADLLNLGLNQTTYDKEWNLTAHIANYFENARIRSSGGLWTYGYNMRAQHEDFNDVFKNMSTNWADFATNAKQYLKVNPKGENCFPPGGNKRPEAFVLSNTSSQLSPNNNKNKWKISTPSLSEEKMRGARNTANIFCIYRGVVTCDS
ncbi:unnamed protein product [Cylicostephanus goldi]|uniref:Uncharacterized protein n=1 Tax=Cylicostephanus goldi TaxID=71465 RepID=A0A3P7PY17_CYLGO|nr:unnamed protein product [Cylicostephanus goldi]